MKTNKLLSRDPTLAQPPRPPESEIRSLLDWQLAYTVHRIIRNVRALRPSSLATPNEIDLPLPSRMIPSLVPRLKILSSLARHLDRPSTLPHPHHSFLPHRSSLLPPTIPLSPLVLPVLPLSALSRSLAHPLVPLHPHLHQRSRLSKLLIHSCRLPVSRLRPLPTSTPFSLTMLIWVYLSCPVLQLIDPLHRLFRLHDDTATEGEKLLEPLLQLLSQGT